MSQYLFVFFEGGGNVPPQLGLVNRLARRGHHVRVLSDACLRPSIEAVGGEALSFSEAPSRATRTAESDYVRDYEARTPLGEFARTRDRLMIGPSLAFARDTLAAIGDVRPDVLAVDWLLFGAILAGRAAGVPTAVICHNPWMVPESGKATPGTGFLPSRGWLTRGRDLIGNRIFTRLFNRRLSTLASTAQSIGLPAPGTTTDVFAGADRVLVLTSEEFELPARERIAGVRFVGPVLDPPDWLEPWSNPWAADDPRPLVVVTASSYFQDPRATLVNAAEAIRRVGGRGLITTGADIDPAGIPTDEAVIATRSAPHGLLFAEADALISHCGFGTIHRALLAGLPVLCVPIGRDQPDVAARVVHAGAGLRASRNASPSKLAQQLGRVLNEPPFRERAAQIGRALKRDIDAGIAIRELETFAADIVTRGQDRGPERRLGMTL
ncbi:MAG: glycosyltransferase [Acidimicrobiales bacterium]